MVFAVYECNFMPEVLLNLYKLATLARLTLLSILYSSKPQTPIFGSSFDKRCAFN